MISYGQGFPQRVYDQSPVFLQNVFTSLYGWRKNRRAYGHHFARYFNSLLESQWYTFDQLAALQRNHLRQFIASAFARSPYWHRIVNRLGLSPDSIQSADDLQRLPLLDKETVRQYVHEMETREYASGQKEAISARTSGTTGKALHFKVSRECWEREHAFRWLHRSWAGARRGDRLATFAGHPVVPTRETRPPFWRENWAERQVIFSSQHISPQNLPYYIQKLIEFKPDLIHGYPSSMYLVAVYVEEQGVQQIRPKAIQTHSETLLDYQRQVIESAFGCKIFNWYGNAELGANIVECEKGSLHVKMEYSLVEFLRSDGEPAKPGEIGELICTAFGNDATPLIRYRTGDAAVVSDRRCECSRADPLVEQIIGRVDDIVVTPDGRHVGRLDFLFKDMLNVVEAQILQDVVDCVRVRIVKRPGFGEADMRLLEHELRLRLGPVIRLEYEFVDKIPRLPNDKFRFVLSKVPMQITGARQPSHVLAVPPQEV